jgi:hypothetical protein
MMTTWLERTDHLADHFKAGITMASWQGDWGFDHAVKGLVETAIPPGITYGWRLSNGYGLTIFT